MVTPATDFAFPPAPIPSVEIAGTGLKAGDLIYTGTPAGVGPLQPGDRVECGIDGLQSLRNTITKAPVAQHAATTCAIK